MNFGKGIIVSFVLFASFIAVLTVICIRQNIDLVSKNYYQEELMHQHKMNQIQNTNRLVHRPHITIQNGILTVAFSSFDKIDKGEVRLLRPSNARLDQLFVFHPAKDTVRHFPLKAPRRGLYRVIMRWTRADKEFYFEKILFL